MKWRMKNFVGAAAKNMKGWLTNIKFVLGSEEVDLRFHSMIHHSFPFLSFILDGVVPFPKRCLVSN